MSIDTATPAPQRTWTQVGARYSTDERKPRVERAIGQLTWKPVSDGMTLPFLPGEGIKAAISELDLRRVTEVAYDGAIDLGGDHVGVYGIENRYGNGRARVYLVDTGTEILPVASDFWPSD